MKRTWRFVVLLLPLLLLVFLFVGRPGIPASSPATYADPDRPLRETRAWLEARRSPGAPAPSANRLDQAITLAAARRERMRELITTDPARALEEAITRTEYADLPAELRPYFEQPFNATATLRVLPVCSGPGHEPERVLEMDNRIWSASVFGRRLDQMTLEDTPLHGITLDGLAAIGEFPLEIPAANDAAIVSTLPIGNADPARDFATGDPLGDSPVTALAGGKRYLFRDTDTLSSTNARLAELDKAVGPENGSRVLFAMAVDGAGIDWPAVEAAVELQASAWSESPKSVFCIRAEFTDTPGQAVGEATLAGVMNTTVHDSVAEMSYGKTWIDADVSPMVVVLPSPTTTYLPSNNSLLHNDAKDAYLALAGPAALDGYDIVVVHFPGIGMSSGGLTYAGLAGGSNQWLQGTTSASVIVHEFGHNYGLPHASFWETTDGSSVGTGANVEYGDFSDVMGGGSVPTGHFHPLGKMRLGWLEASQWADATSSGTYRIYRFDDDATTGALRGLRIDKAAAPEDPEEFYWLGYRGGYTARPLFLESAYLVWQRPGYTNRGWLVDTTPGSAEGRFDAPISIGRTYSDTTAGVHLTPLATGGSGADAWIDVNVQLGDFPGNQSPTGSLVGPSAADARATVAFNAGATDPDGDPLAFTWDFGDGSIAGNVANVSHSWTVGGSYDVICTVTDMKGGTATFTKTVVVADPLDNWSATPLGQPKTGNRIAYLDGRYIATGDDYTYFSFDGVNWTSAYQGINFGGEGIAGGNGAYVIAGEDWNGSQWIANILHSTDGRNWTPATYPGGPELNDVAAGNGLFVAVGNAGSVLRSADGGETWEATAAPISTQNLRAIAFGGGTFVAITADEIHTSTDGLTWFDRSAGHSAASWHSFDTVTYDNGRFYAAGWYTSIHVSDDDGQTWTRHEVAGGHEYDILYLGQGGGALVALGYDKDESDARTLLVSQDGDLWTESTAVLPGSSLGDLTFGGGGFAAASGNPGDAWLSGSFFPTNQPPAASLTGPATADARAQVLFTASGSDPDGDPLRFIWDFKDGSPLVEGSAAAHIFPTGGSYEVDLITTDERGGVTVETHIITITDPLDTWFDRTSGVTIPLLDVAASPTTVVAVGGVKPNYSDPNYLWSTDGTNWTHGSHGDHFETRSVVWDGSQFISAGSEYAFSPTVPTSGYYGAIHTSPDGINWTYRLQHSGLTLNGVAAGGGVHVAVGQTGTVWRSTNAGVSWTSVPAPTTLHLRDVAYLDGRFVAVTESSFLGSPVKVLSSPDGLVWTDVSAGAGIGTWQEFVEIEAIEDRFLVGGWYAGIRYSTDQGDSFTLTGSQNRIYSGYAFGNGIWFAAGIDKDNANAPLDAISQDGTSWIELPSTATQTRNGAAFFADTFITVGNNGSIRQSAPFAAPAETGYAAWWLLHFPEAPPLSDSDEDFDGDGLANIYEYLTGTDPRDATDGIPPVLAWQGADLTVSLPRSPFASDVIVTAEFSTDLGTWGAAGIVILENSGSAFVAVTDSGAPQGFIRLILTLVP